MSQRPRNAQPLGTGGIARLGSSFLAPVLSEFIDNGSPGFPCDSFITVENRLGQPMNVSPAFSDGSADYSSYYSIPPITRSTVPIDPQRGVLLGVSNDIFVNDRSGIGTPTLRTFEKRTIPYRLHSDGAAPSEPLYPAERCMVASSDGILSSGVSTLTYFVGSAWPGGSTQQMATGPDGTCIVGVAFCCTNITNFGATDLIQVSGYPDPAATSQRFIWIPAMNGLANGDLVYIAIPGCVAVAISIATSTASVTIETMIYIGMPGL